MDQRFNRERTHDERQLYPRLFDRVYYDGWRNQYNISLGEEFLGKISTSYDVASHNFYKRIRSGEQVMNPVIVSHTVREGGNMRHACDQPWDKFMYIFHGSFFNILWPTMAQASITESSRQGELSTSCLLKAYAKANASDICGGEVMGEFAKTVRMVRRPIQSAFNLTREMLDYKSNMLLQVNKYGKKYLVRKNGKKFHFPRPLTAAQATANTWLEYRYGWRPLMMDAAEIITQSVQMKKNLVKRTFTSRSSASQTRRASAWTPGNWANNGILNVTVFGTSELSIETLVSAGVRYQIDQQSVSERTAAMLGLRLSDVLPAAWELTPWSFVVDWFINIGDYIQAVSVPPGVSHIGNWVTVINRTTDRRSGSVHYDNGAHVNSAQFSDMVETTTHYERNCGVPIPSYPRLNKGSLSVLHQLDATALLTQKLVNVMKKV